MSLPLDLTLRRVAEAMAARIVPALDDAFALETARLAGMLLTIAANAADDAAALRVDENAAMRALFADAATAIPHGDLAASLREAAASRDPGLRLSALDGENDRLRRLLIALHAQVDAGDDDRARQVGERIWQLLDTFEARRAPLSQPAGQPAPAHLG